MSKYSVTVQGAGVSQVGDHNTMVVQQTHNFQRYFNQIQEHINKSELSPPQKVEATRKLEELQRQTPGSENFKTALSAFHQAISIGVNLSTVCLAIFNQAGLN